MWQSFEKPSIRHLPDTSFSGHTHAFVLFTKPDRHWHFKSLRALNSGHTHFPDAWSLINPESCKQMHSSRRVSSSSGHSHKSVALFSTNPGLHTHSSFRRISCCLQTQFPVLLSLTNSGSHSQVPKMVKNSYFGHTQVPFLLMKPALHSQAPRTSDS